MANEIYHRSNWGNAVNDIAWGDTYEKFDATNEMFVRSDNYENSKETDKLMAAINPKPSILLTPTAYDNGSLHSVKPVKTFGSELITNGNYETDSDWSKGTGCTIENGKANLLNAPAFNFALSQTPSFTVGRKYLVEYSISQHTTGSIIVRLGSNLGTTRNGNGTFSETIIAQANSIIFQPKSIFTGSIDNVSVKEVTEADFDFTRGSSATRVNEKGLIEDVTDTNLPRIDYTDGTGSLLLEPQSTNLVTDSAGGNYGNNPGSEILTTAPDGTNTAVRPVPDSTSDRYQYTISGGSYATDSKLTYTWYRKRITTPIDTSHTGDLKIQILVNCTQVGSTTQIETDVNGFDRFQAVFNITDGSDATLIRGYFGQSIGVGNSSIAYWGHQVEALSFATSLIPTSGSTVTRSADAANNSGSSDLINSTEGVLYVEALLKDTGTFKTAARITATDTITSDGLWIYFRSDNKIQSVLRVGGVDQTGILSNTQTTDEYYKVAFKFKQNDFALWVNGTEVATDTSGNTFSADTLSKLGFVLGASTNPFIGNVKSVAVFKEALTDEELTALTT